MKEVASWTPASHGREIQRKPMAISDALACFIDNAPIGFGIRSGCRRRIVMSILTPPSPDESALDKTPPTISRNPQHRSPRLNFAARSSVKHSTRPLLHHKMLTISISCREMYPIIARSSTIKAPVRIFICWPFPITLPV